MEAGSEGGRKRWEREREGGRELGMEVEEKERGGEREGGEGVKSDPTNHHSSPSNYRCNSSPEASEYQ